MNGTTTNNRLCSTMTQSEMLMEMWSDIKVLRHQMNLLLTALENVRVLSTVRDEDGDVIGINAVVAPPMLETGIQ